MRIEAVDIKNFRTLESVALSSIPPETLMQILAKAEGQQP